MIVHFILVPTTLPHTLPQTLRVRYIVRYEKPNQQQSIVYSKLTKCLTVHFTHKDKKKMQFFVFWGSVHVTVNAYVIVSNIKHIHETY